MSLLYRHSRPDHSLPCREIAEDFLDFVERQLAPGQVPVLVAHNLKYFDHKVMSTEFDVCGMEWPDHWHWLDSYKLATKDDGRYGPDRRKGVRSQVSLSLH